MRLLEELEPRTAREELHRYATVPQSYTEFLQDEGFDLDDIDELLQLMGPQRGHDGGDSALDGPFGRDGGGRYSDGSFPVFYSALEPETAQTEALFWYGSRALGSRRKPRTFYYDHVQCAFDGQTKDLREKAQAWPLLSCRDTQKAYPFCNSLAAAAVAEGLDALYAPSARHAGGTCVPVFRRVALTNANVRELFAFSFQPETGRTSITRCAVGE